MSALIEVKLSQIVTKIQFDNLSLKVCDYMTFSLVFLQNGEIFVFTGILKAVSNEQQLGTVLAHEIAHVVLNHAVSYYKNY